MSLLWPGVRCIPVPAALRRQRQEGTNAPGQPELHTESPSQEWREDWGRWGHKWFIVKQTNKRREPTNQEKRKTLRSNDYVCYCVPGGGRGERRAHLQSSKPSGQGRTIKLECSCNERAPIFKELVFSLLFNHRSKRKGSQKGKDKQQEWDADRCE